MGVHQYVITLWPHTVNSVSSRNLVCWAVLLSHCQIAYYSCFWHLFWAQNTVFFVVDRGRALKCPLINREESEFLRKSCFARTPAGITETPHGKDSAQSAGERGRVHPEPWDKMPGKLCFTSPMKPSVSLLNTDRDVFYIWHFLIIILLPLLDRVVMERLLHFPNLRRRKA